MSECSVKLMELEKTICFVGKKYPEVASDCERVQKEIDRLIYWVLTKEKRDVDSTNQGALK